MLTVIEWTGTEFKKIGDLTPANAGWYWVNVNGSLCGSASTLDRGIKMIEEYSGAAYRRLPIVKRTDIKTAESDWIRTGLHSWVKKITFAVQGRELDGSIQLKKECNSRTGRPMMSALTSFRDTCVLDNSLVWLLQQNGYQLRSQE